MGGGRGDLLELPGWPGLLQEPSLPSPAAVVSPQATVLCDLVLLYLDAKAEFYWEEKFEEVRTGLLGGAGAGVKFFEQMWGDFTVQT